MISMKSKRPWKTYAHIERIELNNGDVKFRSFAGPAAYRNAQAIAREQRGEFEDLTSAEHDLDTWWAGWWPLQIKSRRRA